MLKKFGALVLALLMVLSVSTAAMAENSAKLEENGEEGVAGDWVTADTERLQGNSIVIKKEIVVFNTTDNTTVHAPVVIYTYTVTAASVDNLSVTDETVDHESETAATAPVKAGVDADKVVVTTSTTEDGATLVFTNASTWTAAKNGYTNEYDITLDFSGVTFTQPGVYRYKIDETISAESYDVIAMKDGAYETVYLDVYVDGNYAIYGYVCMNANASVTPDTTTKINGFVNGTAADGSDKYYTYNLVLSKDVVNDQYAATTHAFPFTVIFSNPEGYTSTFTIGQTVGNNKSTGLNGSAATLTGLPTAWNGVALVNDGNATTGTTVGDITLTGIPAGVDVDVYETNDMTGVTYTVVTEVNDTKAAEDDNVSWGTTPSSAVAQTTRAAYESTKVSVNTPKIAAVSAGQSVAITNTLLLISPTGVVLRIAPYVLILAAGIALLLISRRRKAAGAEE